MGKVSLEDKHLIKALRLEKKWGATKIKNFSSQKPWKLTTLKKLLNIGILPDIRQRCGLHNWVLQQDGAPSHRSAATVAFLDANGISYIEPTMWPPNSPDINPVDYAVWGALEQTVYKHKPRNVNELKDAIKAEWGRLSQRLITRSIDQWRSRLAGVVSNNGGHIEHQL
jgi:hypothetical protein